MATSPRRRTLATVAAAALLTTLFTVTLGPTPTAAAPPTYAATITRTAHGIPHIVANDWGSLGFGSGYATAQTSGCTLADILITARGTRARWLGPEGHYDDGVAMNGTNLQSDALVTDLHNRHVVEDLLADPKAGPGAQARAMVTGYAAGVNKYLQDIGGSGNITDPACKGAPYITPDVTALDIWYGVYLANIIASTGNFLKEIVDATPPSLKDPGLPSLATFGIVPPELPSASDVTAALRPDENFGSNATALGGSATTTGSGMLLGNPHFPWNGRYRFTQQQLTIPGQYDVAGASLIGSPVVNIGWNKNVAWSHTVSTAYRFTPYEYRTVGSPYLYLTSSGLLKKVEKRVVTVTVKNDDGSLGTATKTLYRTPQGYVIDSPNQLMGWTPLSFFAIRDANGEQLRTVDTFLDMGKATDVHDLIAKQDAGGGMPWVNTTAADRNGDVVYADHSVVPNVSNSMANACMTPIGRVLQQLSGGLPALDGTFADNLCKWRTDADAERPGIFGSKNLPAAYRRDWVMNANDSYWLPNPAQKLTGFAKIIGCENCMRTFRTKMVDQYVIDALKTGKISATEMRGFEHQNRVRGAEIIGNAALVKVCQAADGGDACPVLANWDLHSNIESVGNHIFEEFVKRLPGAGLLGGELYWKVPFNSAEPLNTPRNLDTSNGKVIKAMREAIAYLRSKNIPMDATWGSLQVSGDRGAPAIPLGGGLGDQAGNANALASRGVVDNGSYFRPITYGSSHIQAISFLPGGAVDAHTILTYGQSDDPTSPWSSDQTVLFGHKQWVDFAFTPSQIASDQVSSVTITG